MKHIPDLSQAHWVKSSHSGGNGGECVEYAPSFAAEGVVPVRDSKAPRQALAFPTDQWSAFVTGVRDGSLA
ncbi:DUF397 domain-containing protein [Streptomyces sp. JJ66]|uniref:DUF397 domain-containing protein n=1 Tax=Streptomyces sp. JJ66 TaxID=2803843 RepID=UPI001C55C455|nr:DUF397 domain-containing protein [Streptomyces sp. JJ66]MBW1602716.1 DUF397 domain-containing protein [Streptomyces sp. JJ66]